MGFAKKEKKNKISLRFFFLPVYTQKKIEKETKNPTFTPNPLPIRKKKIFKITSFENVADSFPKYKKRKVSPTSS